MSVTGIGVLIGLLGWREAAHYREEGRWVEHTSLLQGDLKESQSLGDAALKRAERSETTLAGLEIEHQTLRDRLTNLEAQRDHLRADNERQTDRVQEVERARDSIQEELQLARRERLEQSALPRELRSQLEQARVRIVGLEARLDEETLGRSTLPRVWTVEGQSGDGMVFALSGDLPDSGALPFPVYLCKRNTILMEGWVNRIDDGMVIGHVENWKDPVSNLVKGEKVFILPRTRHEAVP